MIFDGDGPGTSFGGIFFFLLFVVFPLSCYLWDKIRGRK